MFTLWKPYVQVAQRRTDAAREMQALAKKGIPISPITIQGRAIATSVWGKAWCTHLEKFSDYANRLPRGRTYVRNGSVVDLQITPGKIQARVQGSSLYSVTISITKMERDHWQKLCGSCAGGIDSLVELLQGRLSTGVMERLCHHTEGMFPSSRHIRLDCSCPDDARLCKHLAAVLYGIGARLDHQPELLFLLRQVDASELLSSSGAGLAGALAPAASERVLVSDDLATLFGVEMDVAASPGPVPIPIAIPTPRSRSAPAAVPARRAAQRTTARKRTALPTAHALKKTRVAAAVARILRMRDQADKLARAERLKRAKLAKLEKKR